MRETSPPSPAVVVGIDGSHSAVDASLWAVDEGVLALTGYKTPDPIDLLYRERGLGMRLASNRIATARFGFAQRILVSPRRPVQMDPQKSWLLR